MSIDKSGANLAALRVVNAGRDTPTKVCQVKYLNNVIEQDHWAIKRIDGPKVGFKDFRRECHSEWHRDHTYDRQREDEAH